MWDCDDKFCFEVCPFPKTPICRRLDANPAELLQSHVTLNDEVISGLKCSEIVIPPLSVDEKALKLGLWHVISNRLKTDGECLWDTNRKPWPL